MKTPVIKNTVTNYLLVIAGLLQGIFVTQLDDPQSRQRILRYLGRALELLYVWAAA
ncbi:MAG: hypothetical protein PHI85_02675 [Victivallaceae bacterium]|nr:hypothetical protein [Victivallaceae bacterium]